MATKFKPTKARGVDLAEEVLARIEAEVKFLQDQGIEVNEDTDSVAFEEAVSKVTVWNQGTWGEIHLDSMPSGTRIEAVQVDDYSAPALAIPSGVSCGTAMCFAGHVATMAGDRMTIHLPRTLVERLGFADKAKIGVKKIAKAYRKHYNLDSEEADPLEFSVSTVVTPEGVEMTTSRRAAKLLGLDDGDAYTLFSGSNTLADLRRYVKRMRKGVDLETGHPKRES